MPDASGKLSPEDKNKIIAWLTRDGRPTPICPICGTQEWAIADHVTQPITVGGAGGGLVLGGVGYPNIMVVSTRCGYTMYVNAVIAGILPAAGSSENG
jgi:hypothetical protein